MENNSFIESIIKNKTKCFFISPHLDDAAFSAGELMSRLSGKVEMVAINVFTGFGDGKNTLSAKNYLKQCGVDDPKKLYSLRIAEDDAALSSLGAKIYNLGYTEALWRKRKHPSKLRMFLSKYIPEFDRLYPVYRLHIESGKIHQEDQKLISEIGEKIKSMVGNYTNYKIFCPIGFGDHVDHLVTREACVSISMDIIYWSDFPYCLNSGKSDFIRENGLAQHALEVLSDKKIKLCQLYKSQINQVIKDKRLLFKPEVFYVRVKGKKNFNAIINTSINDKLIEDWNKLWKESPNKNYFNSPNWYLACQDTFNYSQTVFILCYQKDELVGIAPLALTKKYRITAYSFLGNQYLDKSSILTANNDPEILITIIKKISELGNFYIAEMGELAVNILLNYNCRSNISKCSTGFYLPLLPDPHRYFRPKHKNPLIKKLKEEQGNFEYKMYFGDVKTHLKTVLDIESESSKKVELKEVFSDPLLRKLCMNLEKYAKNSTLINVLFYKNESVCYQYGFVSDHTYHWFQTGYKEAFRYLVPGKKLMYLILPDLIKKEIKVMDFSRGINDLKKEFTPFFYHQYSVFDSPNRFIISYWKCLNYLRNGLEKYPKLFEAVRKLIR